MTANRDDQEKIISYIDFILKHPKELKYFAFSGERRKFIVDGNKIKMLPMEYAKLYNKDEFYLEVDPDRKKVIYYAFDVEDYTSSLQKDEELGHFEWDKVSDQICAFLTVHLKELSSAVTPYNDIVEKKDNSTTSKPMNRSEHHGRTYVSDRRYESDSDYPHSGRSSSTASNSNNYNWSSSSYKEREAFCSKVTDLIKEYKTSLAIDHINAGVKKLCEEKKFDDLDNILRWITFEKLNIPTMITLLYTTRGADHLLKERKDFYGKVKNHIMKIKPTRADHILRNMEPGKDYGNIIKYAK